MSINNLQTRIKYAGGAAQRKRFDRDKLQTLKKALLYSYQAATAILADGREFRCLINPNKLSLDLDDKYISIPYRDICLNSEEEVKVEEDINIKEGDIITWKENGSHWLIFLQKLEETAYFRANIRRCHYEITLDDGTKSWVYIRGPVEQTMVWAQKSNNYYNLLNYSLVMYVPKTDKTWEYFHRFTKITLDNRPWEVQAVDSISNPGIIEVALKETFSNTPETDIATAVAEAVKEEVIPEKEGTYIYGPAEVYPYDVKRYEIRGAEGPYSWRVEAASRANMVKLTNAKDNTVDINIITGKSGTFILACYSQENTLIASLKVAINSL